MFYLIVILVAIVTSASLAAAHFWYGGKIFANGMDRTQALTIIANASQVETAVAAYGRQNDADMPSSLTQLVSEGYLERIPELGVETEGTTRTAFFLTTTPSGDVVLANILWGRDDVCAEVNGMADVTASPAQASAAAVKHSRFACATTPASATNGATGADDPTFFMRL